MRETPIVPMSPYGTSKLMSEIMLHDAGKAHGLRFVICAISTSPVPTEITYRTGDIGCDYLIKIAARRPSASGRKCRCWH